MNNRWSVYVPDKERRMRGEEILAEAAVEALGPFNEKFPVERLSPWDGTTTKLSKKLAREHVDGLAENYLINDWLNQNAPRQSKILEDIRKLADLTASTSSYLQSLDDLARIELQMGVSNPLSLPVSPIVEQANVAGLPLPGDLDQGSSAWVRQLDALTLYVRHIHNLYSRGIDAVDKGGNTNAYKSEWGSARCALVNQGWTVYEFYKPGQATGSVEGPFHEFLDAVFEYATGLPNEDAKLTSWLKIWPKVNRRGEELIKQLAALEIERKNLTRLGNLPDRIEEIWKEEDAIHDEHMKLLRSVPPFLHG